MEVEPKMADIPSDYASEVIAKNSTYSSLSGSTIKYRHVIDGVHNRITRNDPEESIGVTIFRSLIRHIPNELVVDRWTPSGIPVVNHMSLSIANNLGLTIRPRLHSLAILKELEYLIQTNFAKRVIGYVDKNGILQKAYLYVRASANVPEHLVRPIGSVAQRTRGNYPTSRTSGTSKKDTIISVLPTDYSNAITSTRCAELLEISNVGNNRSALRAMLSYLARNGAIHSERIGDTRSFRYWK